MKNSGIRTAVRLFIILLCASALMSLPAFLIYRYARHIIVGELGKNAMNIAATVSAFAEKNIEKFQKIPGSSFEIFSGADTAVPSVAGATGLPSRTAGARPDEDPPASNHQDNFQIELADIFNALMKTTGAQNIYIERKISETQKAYLILSDNGRRPVHYPSGAFSESEQKAFNSGLSAPSDILTDKTVGEYIAGYVPITDPISGHIDGIVAVEFPLMYAEHITNGIRNFIISCSAAMTLLVTAVVYLLFMSRQKYFAQDDLTALRNKRYFERQLPAAVRRAHETQRPLSLIMIDIDCFKDVNDHFGHPIGDSVLRAVSEVLLQVTRGGDLCARYGGDEFVILLTNCDKAQAGAVAERIRVEASVLHNASKIPDTHVTVSIGVAALASGMTAEQFMESADQAMYASKKTGKDKVTVGAG